MEAKKLYRNPADQMIAGVCSGLAEYLTLDVTVIRLIFVLLALMGGNGLLIYLILWLVMPVKPISTHPRDDLGDRGDTDG